jgi:hypothetical protein
MYSYSIDGQPYSRSLSASGIVRLKFAEFDPRNGEPAIEASLGAEATAGANQTHRLFIVQFIIPPLQSMLDELRDVGATPLIYLPDECEIVAMTGDCAAQAAQLPFVRWVGPFHPAYKLDPALRSQLGDDLATAPAGAYSLVMFERGADAHRRVADRLAALGARAQLLAPEGLGMQARLDGPQLLHVLRMNEVLFVDAVGEAGTDMDVARQVGGAVPLLSDLGFTGQGVRGEVMDSGCRITHAALQNPPLLIHSPGTPFVDDHGTSTTGIVFGSGAGSDPVGAGTGMLPDAEQGIFFSYVHLLGQPGGTISRYAATQQLVNPAGPYRAVFQSNGWGHDHSTSYNFYSSDFEDILFRFDVLVCQSQGNTGSTMSRPEAWAKNVVSVGGIHHLDTVAHSDDHWSISSTGPASDGRVKPDLVHFDDVIYCPTGPGNLDYTPTFNGTSAAASIVAGHFGLLFQMWHEGVFAGFGGGLSVFDDRPHMSTAKALMINSAYRYDWPAGGTNSNLTRARQGWGIPNLARLYNDRGRTHIINESHPIRPGQSKIYVFHASDADLEFRATMVYSDLRGNPAASVSLINDLSMRVTAPDGTMYWGNFGLNDGNYSTPGGTANSVDTVENVFVANPISGPWTVSIFADDIVDDAHWETLSLDADFALVVVAADLCLGDITGDHVVGVADLIRVLTFWNNPFGQQADLNNDGHVNMADLLLVIANWGPCD